MASPLDNGHDVGNRTRIDDAEAHSTYFAYDLLGRLASEHDAIGKVETYEYDPVGNLTARTDGDSQDTYYVYDALGRQSRIDFPEGTSAYYSYDANGNLTAAWDDAGGETLYFAYDPLDRVTSRTILGVGSLYYEYDLAGRRTMVKDWTDTAVYYAYDGRGLITRVHSPAGHTYYAYDARGAVTKRELPNGAVTYYAYDAAGRTTSIADRKSDGSAICSFDFTRDPNGNITKSLREDDSCWYYEYDGLQRLTEAEWKDSGGASLYAFAYDYDKVGNRTHLLFNDTHTYYSYNAANELTVESELGDDVAYYTYDGRGNQTQREILGGDTTYFGYNSRNLITRIDSTEAGFTPNTFAYNALGQRVRKADSTGATYYIWDGLNITHEHDGSGTLKRRYTHGHTPIPGVLSLLDVQYFDYDTDPHYFYHQDQIGGVRRLTTAAEATAQSLEFSPYGRMLEETGSAPNEFMFPANYVFLNDSAQMLLSPFRMYDPKAGRFLARDALGGGAVPRDYVYAACRPTVAADPSGLWDRPGVERILCCTSYEWVVTECLARVRMNILVGVRVVQDDWRWDEARSGWVRYTREREVGGAYNRSDQSMLSLAEDTNEEFAVTAYHECLHRKHHMARRTARSRGLTKLGEFVEEMRVGALTEVMAYKLGLPPLKPHFRSEEPRRGIEGIRGETILESYPELRGDVPMPGDRMPERPKKPDLDVILRWQARKYSHLLESESQRDYAKRAIERDFGVRVTFEQEQRPEGRPAPPGPPGRPRMVEGRRTDVPMRGGRWHCPPPQRK